MGDNLTRVKQIVEKLTHEQSSILSEKIYNLAAELGIGDMLVQDCLNQLAADNYIQMPIPGVIKRM